MLGSILAQIYREFCKALRYFSRILWYFVRIFIKSKLLGVRLHPLLLHQCMLMLRNKGQQAKTTVARFITYLCKQRSRHEWAASLQLHDTRTRNLALVQCECLTGKQTVIARIKLINLKQAADLRFSRKFWFLVTISGGGKCRFALPPCGRPCLSWLTRPNTNSIFWVLKF